MGLLEIFFKPKKKELTRPSRPLPPMEDEKTHDEHMKDFVKDMRRYDDYINDLKRVIAEKEAEIITSDHSFAEKEVLMVEIENFQKMIKEMEKNLDELVKMYDLERKEQE